MCPTLQLRKLSLAWVQTQALSASLGSFCEFCALYPAPPPPLQHRPLSPKHLPLGHSSVGCIFSPNSETLGPHWAIAIWAPEDRVLSLCGRSPGPSAQAEPRGRNQELSSGVGGSAFHSWTTLYVERKVFFTQRGDSLLGFWPCPLALQTILLLLSQGPQGALFQAGTPQLLQCPVANSTCHSPRAGPGLST